MTRREYTERVLAALRRVTPEERAAVRAEIDAHMEDHVCDLLDLGYSPELAEERTMSFMGDPEEVGRELDKQYPLGWLAVGRMALTLTVALCIAAFLGAGMLLNAWDSITYRVFPPESRDAGWTAAVTELDIRMPVGNDILWIYRVSLGERNGERVAEVAMCAYDRIPGGIVSEQIFPHITVRDQRGDSSRDGGFGGGTGSWGGTAASRRVNVRPGDTYVTLYYERFGESFVVDIPLPEEETA